jgi:hypothetical protein
MFAAVGESEAEAERSDGSRGAELRLRVMQSPPLVSVGRSVDSVSGEAVASCNFSVGAFSGGMSAIAATPRVSRSSRQGKDSQKTWPMSIH